MACPRCGSDTRPGQKFCAECGLALAQRCPNCGTPYDGTPKFCAECGAALAHAQAQPPAEPPPAQQAQAGDPATPSAERRFVSILFADLVGFTQMSEQQDPEEVRDLLSRYFETARHAIGSYGGTVEKFIGDAVMAVWGAPTAHEDDAERAVRAALDLVQAVSELSLVGQPLALRAAVLSGEAAVSAGRTGEGMVAGDVVNTASRLQSVAPPGVVLVGEQTRNATSAAIAYEPAGEQLLKGKQAPIAAWRALRVVARVGGEGREEGLEAPFVGRQVELRLLKDQLHAAENERRLRVVSITGQAGMGKSRLVWELEKYLDGLAETTYYWHQGRSPSYGEGVTFWALGEMVRRRARIAEADDEPTTREKLRATLADFVPDADERRRLEPALGALLGIDDVDWDAREQLFSAWRTFFERITERGPSVLVFEDLQWADSGLFDFIDHLMTWSRDRPILIVALARPEIHERRPEFGAGQGAFVALHLEPLSDEAMAALLRGLVPALPDKDLQRIVGRAEGVPLYAVETVRSLVDGGHLVRNGDIYELAGTLPPLEVPPTLRALIASRLDALHSDERSLLQDASVVGLVFAIPALAALSGRRAEEVEARLRALSHKELVALETDPQSPERGQYRFVQGLIREVAYASLAKRERRTRHLSVARYFEQIGDEELAGALASHYLEAYRAAPQGPEGEVVAAQARVALRGAAERASRLHSHEQALAFLEQALAVTFDPAEQAQLRIQAARSADTIGRFEAARDHLQAALDFYEEAGDSVEAARTARRLARVLNGYSKVEEAAALARSMLERPLPESERVSIGLNAELARSYMFQGRAKDALEPVSRALETAERLGLRDKALDLLITKSWAQMLLGAVAEATVLLWGAMRIADDADDLNARLRTRMNLSSYLSTDDLRVALRIAEEGVDLARGYGMGEWAAALAGNAASLALAIGDLDRLARIEAEVLEYAPGPHSQWLVGFAGAGRALAGDFDGAHERLARLERELRGSTSTQDLSGYRFMLAMVDVAQGDLSAAREHISESRRAYNSSDAVLGTGCVAQLAALAGDRRALREEHAHLRQMAKLGAWTERAKRAAEAALAALDGRSDEALAAYRRVIEECRADDLWLDLGLLLLVRARLLGALDEEAAAGADEARAIFERIGAHGLAERLERGIEAGTAAKAPTIDASRARV